MGSLSRCTLTFDEITFQRLYNWTTLHLRLMTLFLAYCEGELDQFGKNLWLVYTKGKVCWVNAQGMWLISARVYPGFYSFKHLGVLLTLDGMLVHRRIPPKLLLVPNYSWVEKQVGLSVLLKDMEKQIVAQSSIEPRTSRTGVRRSCHYTTTLLTHVHDM